jgi:cytochrome c-type biogenesis protein CcmH/NrfG
MPAVTLWVFCAGGAALASSAKDGAGRAPAGPRTRLLIALGVLLLALTPALLGLSQRQLNDSIRAFKHGNCSAAVDAALNSISTLSVRPEPYEVLGYCDARTGLGRPAISAFEAAIRRDPRNWELHYGLAVVRAASGRNPRRAARSALRLNPRSELVKAAVKSFSTPSPSSWRRRARATPLPIP